MIEFILHWQGLITLIMLLMAGINAIFNAYDKAIFTILMLIFLKLSAILEVLGNLK